MTFWRNHGPLAHQRGVKRLYIMGLDFQAGWDIYDSLRANYKGRSSAKR
jgi:hypothetical protein